MLFYFVYLFYLFSCQGITHMNSSGAVGDILVFTFVNLGDNAVTENRKYLVVVVYLVVIFGSNSNIW